jgi:hypothetical protein
LKDIAKEFKTDIPSVTATLFLTLAMRPLGAFLFGMMADTQLQIQSRVKSLDRSSHLSYTKRILPPMKRAIYYHYRAACFSSTVAIIAPPELTYCDFLSGRQRVEKTGRRGIDWSQV